jgi:hypothetical protein
MIRTTALLAALAGVVASGLAQSLPSAPHLTLEQRSAFLLADPLVRQKIGLPAPVATKVSASFASYAKQQDKLYAAKKPNEAAIQKLDVTTATGLLASLPARQKRGLYKIALSQAGVSALLAPDVAKSVKLTPDQVNKIDMALQKAAEPSERLEQAVSERMVAAKDDAERKAIDAEYASERKRLAKLRQAEEAKVLKLLKPEQQKAWTALSK